LAHSANLADTPDSGDAEVSSGANKHSANLAGTNNTVLDNLTVGNDVSLADLTRSLHTLKERLGVCLDDHSANCAGTDYAIFKDKGVGINANRGYRACSRNTGNDNRVDRLHRTDLAGAHNARHNSASICSNNNASYLNCALHPRNEIANSNIGTPKLAYPLHTRDLDISINDAKCRKRGCCKGGYTEHLGF
jgi:hypothetical protein